MNASNPLPHPELRLLAVSPFGLFRHFSKPGDKKGQKVLKSAGKYHPAISSALRFSAERSIPRAHGCGWFQNLSLPVFPPPVFALKPLIL
jgi:hypothetical protein